MIGEKMSKILIKIEEMLWEYESKQQGKPDYTNEGFRAAIKIFMVVLFDKMWDLYQNDGMDQEDRKKMANSAGEEMRLFIKKYTNIDTHELYK